jgi:PknH-like extracellular domain
MGSAAADGTRRTPPTPAKPFAGLQRVIAETSDDAGRVDPRPHERRRGDRFADDRLIERLCQTVSPVTTVPAPSQPSRRTDAASADLRQHLLTLDDLPPGRSPSPEDTDEEDSSTTADPPECGSSLREEEFETAQSKFDVANVEYQQSMFGPFIANGVIAYDTSDQAEQTFDKLIDEVNACRRFTETDESGNTIEYTFAPLSMDRYGDQTFATVLRGASLVGQVEANLVYFRDGRYLEFVATAAFGAVLSIDMDELVATAADELP